MILLVTAACATRTPAPVVRTPQFPEFLFPDVPADLAASRPAQSHRDAWQFLQAGDLRNAERQFSTALKGAPQFYPAEAGLGYVGLAARDYPRAVERFDRALGLAPAYVPALVGRGEALLAQAQGAEALASFEAALAADPSLTEVRRRIDVLRLRTLQDEVAAAQRAAGAGDLEGARAAYERAVAASPESGFLYRELAIVEQRQGSIDKALEHAQRAIQLDASDARAFVLVGEIHEARGDLDGAIAAYRAARAIDPGLALDERIERAGERVALARLPAEYRAIAEATRVTRAQLAALLGVRLERHLQGAPRRSAVVATDTRNHWATPWILAVTRAGVMDVYPNHTFQPEGEIRRIDLAQAVSRALGLIVPTNPAAAARWRAARPKFSDLGPGHLGYPAAAQAVAAGVLTTLDGDTFQPGSPVTGAEAFAAIARLEALGRR